MYVALGKQNLLLLLLLLPSKPSIIFEKKTLHIPLQIINELTLIPHLGASSGGCRLAQLSNEVPYKRWRGARREEQAVTQRLEGLALALGRGYRPDLQKREEPETNKGTATKTAEKMITNGGDDREYDIRN